MHITIENAVKAVEAARKAAVKAGLKMCIAIVDSGANLKAFHRMDDAWVGSIDVAIKKARTAVFFMMPTGEVGKLSQPGKPLYGIEISNDGLITFPGGLPIVDENGVLVGGIGVSGSTVEDDDAVARAGAKISRRNGDPRTSLADVVSRRAPKRGASPSMQRASFGEWNRPQNKRQRQCKEAQDGKYPKRVDVRQQRRLLEDFLP